MTFDWFIAEECAVLIRDLPKQEWKP